MSAGSTVKLGDLVSGLALFAIGAAGLFWAVDAQVEEVAGFGAYSRLYPKILCALLMVLGAGILAGGLTKRPASAATADWAARGRVVGVVAVGAGFAAAAPWIGFIAATVLATGAFALICGVRRPLSLAAISLGTALAIRVVAVELLGLTLPGLGSI